MLKTTGKQVCTVSLPSQKNPVSEQEWIRQMEKCIRALEKHTHRFMTKYSLRKAERLVERAKKQARLFLELSGEKLGLVNGICRMFILNSYYFTDNVEEWSSHLENMNQWLAKCNVPEKKTEKQSLISGLSGLFSKL